MKRNTDPLPLPDFFAETLRETLEESSLSQAEIARRCGIPAPQLTRMKQGKRHCTPEYNPRLSNFFGITPGIWMNLQLDDEFMRADREKGEAIRKDVQPCAAWNSRNVEMRNLTPFLTPFPMIYLHVMKRPGAGAPSPLDNL